MADAMASSRPLTAKSLSIGLKDNELRGRLEGKRCLYVEMEYGKPPVVRFEGFWNAMFIKGAFNSISKAYRILRAKPGDKRYLDKGGSK